MLVDAGGVLRSIRPKSKSGTGSVLLGPIRIRCKDNDGNEVSTVTR